MIYKILATEFASKGIFVLMKNAVAMKSPRPLLIRPHQLACKSNKQLLMPLAAGPQSPPVKYTRSPRKYLHQNTLEYVSIPNAPVTPAMIIKDFSDLINRHEKSEVFQYKQIFYIRKSPQFKSVTQDDPDYFVFKKDEHIKYRYQQIVEICRGNFGSVLKCYDHKTKKIVAVKLIKDRPKIHKQILMEKVALDMIQEADPKFTHFIVPVIDKFYFRGFHCFCFELLWKDTYTCQKDENFVGYEDGLLKTVSKQICDSLIFFHSLGLVHCDIKPENIVWTNDQKTTVNLIDFGCCCHEGNPLFKYMQSRFYRAPEVILHISFTRAIDVWSFGLVIIELKLGHPLYAGNNEKEQLGMYYSSLGPSDEKYLRSSPRFSEFFGDDASIKNEYSYPLFDELVVGLDPDLVDLVRKCLEWDPNKRIKMTEVLKHPYLVNK